MSRIGPGIERWWNDLGRPDLTPAVVDRLVAAFGAAETRPIAELEAERDALLLALLETLQATRQSLAQRSGETPRSAPSWWSPAARAG